MTWVITTDDRLVNLDHVAVLTPTGSGGYQMLAADGRNLGVTNEDVFRATDIIVPATAGQEAWLITNFDGEIEARKRTVVAWTVSTLGVLPIIAGDPLGSNEEVLTIHADGGVERPEETTWSSIEKALESLRAEAVSRQRARKDKSA